VKLRVLLALFALLSLALGTPARAEFTFALLGDTPYGGGEEAAFSAMLDDINRSDVAFAVHVGDFKNGWTSCGDAVFEQRRALFDSAKHAFIYIPGDNEWTDCSRLLAGRYDPLERLSALRKRFFSGATSLGQTPLKLTRQSDDAAAPFYPEHMRWQHDGVLFVTLNFPGGDNNSGMPQESAERTAAALAWMRQGFAQARAQKAPGIVVLMQANPFLRSGNARRGYEALLAALAHETAGYSGQVLLGHGDTHIHRIDHPLRDAQSGRVLENFTRAEVFGSPDVNWLRVRVSEKGGRAVFAISTGR
jgi:hypothetical protein